MPLIKHAVVAAAGLGSRLGMDLPKCLVEAAGKPLLQHLLERLEGIEDVRIVTGFKADQVIETALAVRPDVIFVQNHAYRSTTTLTSYVMGAEGVSDNVLYMDADIFFDPASFGHFLSACEATNEPIIAVTAAKTQDCVYVDMDISGRALSFSRSEVSKCEWANLAWLPAGILKKATTSVFEQLAFSLPIQTIEIESYEVDTLQDLNQLNGYLAQRTCC
jgi:NDP-sugar pyrophosphorylase family protein